MPPDGLDLFDTLVARDLRSLTLANAAASRTRSVA
jgi:hypothetical protein